MYTRFFSKTQEKIVRCHLNIRSAIIAESITNYERTVLPSCALPWLFISSSLFLLLRRSRTACNTHRALGKRSNTHGQCTSPTRAGMKAKRKKKQVTIRLPSVRKFHTIDPLFVSPSTEFILSGTIAFFFITCVFSGRAASRQCGSNLQGAPQRLLFVRVCTHARRQLISKGTRYD